MNLAELREFAETGVIRADRMRAVEGNAMALGLSALQMMESAGAALARMALEYRPSRVLILCGRGNNGGDGMAAARYLQGCVDTDIVWQADGPATRETEVQRELLAHSAAALHPLQCADDLRELRHLFSQADVIIDAMLGTGAAGTPREPLATAVALANESGAHTISADVPTPGIIPARILAFHRPKGHGAEVADIGIPLEAEVCTGPGDLTLVPRRPASAHKGQGGEVLVIGGGPYQGAPYLAGLGALRAGADLVRIASPAFEPIPDLIYIRLEGNRIGEEHLETLIPLAERADAVVCGNGLGQESHAVMRAIAPHCRKAVFDADALRVPLPAAKETVYTPHAGEFERMTGKKPPGALAARGKAVRTAAGKGTVLLKGPVDVISDGTRVRFNRAGSPAMAVAGTGDVLAGVAGALLCKLPAFEAACIAAYVNGTAGTRAAYTKGDGMLASDLLDRIPEVLFGGVGRDG
ncbi:MAG: NAD(P)H-hydrate dehydratase [Methanomicrobiales archaeon]|nr:NAD(P)H-hydrate dehydratase [Methanomicrobiales archaeon]